MASHNLLGDGGTRAPILYVAANTRRKSPCTNYGQYQHSRLSLPPLRIEFFENMVEEDNDCGYRWTTPSSLVSLWRDLTAALRFNADTGVSCGVNCMTRNNKNKNKSTTDIPKAH